MTIMAWKIDSEFKPLTVLSESPGLVPSPHVAVHISNPSFRGSDVLFSHLQTLLHMWHTHIYSPTYIN